MMVAGDKRRNAKDIKSKISWKELASKLEYAEPRDACLIALLYLSGRRISEVLGLKKLDFMVEDNRISFETFNEKDYRKTQQGEYTVERYVKQHMFKGRKSEPYEGILFYRKINPHWLVKSESGILTHHVMDRLNSLKDDEYLFKSLRGKQYISRQMAYIILRRMFPNSWLHLLRHERFTEAAKLYVDDPIAMHRFTFHKRFESTLEYIREQKEKERI